MVRKLTSLVEEDAKERVIQEHLFDHLWLLDASWERATRTEFMESRVETAFAKVDESLTEEQHKARLDIKYTTTGNKHVIIELKRAGRILDTTDLYGQISKYRTAIAKVLEAAGKGNAPLEFICVVGRRLRDWDDAIDGERVSRATLDALSARVVMYDELIQNALEAYQDYVDGASNAGRVYELINSISIEDVEEMSSGGR